MDEIKNLTEKEINLIAFEKGFQKELIIKDYFITLLLYILKDINGALFKGGTALQKILLDYSRISEDIDFTLQAGIETVKKEIIKVIDKSSFFGEISKDKDVDKVTRLIVPYKFDGFKGEIFIDLNERAKNNLKPEYYDVKHFYSGIPPFKFKCLAAKEMIAEKVSATIGRNKPRDHYDVYQIIRHKLPIDTKLVRKKCIQSGYHPSIIKMFNRAKKLHKRWDEDLLPLIKDEVPFEEVMKTLSKFFNLKEEKEK